MMTVTISDQDNCLAWPGWQPLSTVQAHSAARPVSERHFFFPQLHRYKHARVRSWLFFKEIPDTFFLQLGRRQGGQHGVHPYGHCVRTVQVRPDRGFQTAHRSLQLARGKFDSLYECTYMHGCLRAYSLDTEELALHMQGCRFQLQLFFGCRSQRICIPSQVSSRQALHC
jgi:hypothetical protein